LTDLFHIVQENFMWLAMVAMQHKNKGLFISHQHAATPKYINPTQISVFNKCLVLTITTFKMMGMVMRYYLCPLARKFWWEHCNWRWKERWLWSDICCLLLRSKVDRSIQPSISFKIKQFQSA